MNEALHTDYHGRWLVDTAVETLMGVLIEKATESNMKNSVEDNIHMGQDHQGSIEEIMGQIQCPKNFKCYKSGFEALCKAKYIGIEPFLECLEETPQSCKFSLFLGRSYFCQCPLRAYIAKKFKK